MFYDRFAYLCKEKGVTVSRGATEAGISKSLVTKWKTNSVETPSPEVLNKLSKYFNMPISELLCEETEKAPAEVDKRNVTDNDIMFALFGGRGDITKEMYEEVKSFAAYIVQREEAKKKE